MNSLLRRGTVLTAAASLLAIAVLTISCDRNGSVAAGDTVVVYCAQDKVYAEPILAQFGALNAVRVKAVYDSEAVKTVGLANRLLAEKPHPQCDVFWGNEELRTRQLAAAGVFTEQNGWAAMGCRTRRIVINTNLVSADSAASLKTLLQLTNSSWQGKVALAYPQFGTTATHFHALRQHWGTNVWTDWCQRLAANKPLLVDGNSVVVATVARGDAWVGLTDSDDVEAVRTTGAPVAALPTNEETLSIPNTVARIRNSPNPEMALQLWDYLRQRSTVSDLVRAGALEDVSGDSLLKKLNVSWDDLLRDLESTTQELNRIFLR